MRGLYIYNILAVVALSLCGCSANEAEVVVEGYGRVAFDVTTQAKLPTTATRSDMFELPARYTPSVEDMTLRVVADNLEFDESYESVAEYNELLPYLPAGDYTAFVVNGAEESAQFSGSVAFTAVARRLDAQESLVATLQNSALTCEPTESFLGYFAGGATLVVSTESGERFTFEYGEESSDDLEIYFVDAGLDIYLEGEGTKQAATESGRAETVTFAKQKIGTTAATTMSRIEVDASGAGGASLKITLNDTITEFIESELELNPFALTL